MNKYLIIIISLFLFIDCIGNGKTNNLSKNNPTDQGLSKDSECAEKLKSLIITSSNFDNPFKNELSAKINKNDDTNYTIELYVYDSGENSENIVGWIKLDIINNLLIDITNDPDEGVILQYNPKLYSEYLLSCLGLKTSINEESKEYSINKREKLKICTLPFDFDEYYDACYNSTNTNKCEQKYPKYLFNEESALSKIIKGKYNPVEYMYLPEAYSYQVAILCCTDTDIETYILLIFDENQIVSSLEIGRISEDNIISFNISENYLITLYKQNQGEDKKMKWKSFKIDSNGEIKPV